MGAYKIVVSEIMLQQTQVSRVMEKYKEFLKAFPTLQSLSRASLGNVLKLWQGLGYNRRARFLHQFAKRVIERHGGVIPRDGEGLLALPGIGKGTAGSIMAFAYNLPVVFIETNIRRVYIHHFFADKDTVSDKQILPIVEATLPSKNYREWYYALMDYGAHLKNLDVNPNRKSKHYVKQSKFDGSNREVRGVILKYLSNHEKLSDKKYLTFTKTRFEKALTGLIKEGFVKRKGAYIVLA